MQINMTLTGQPGVPLLTHNVRLANPLDTFAKQMKEISGKTRKTDEDHLDLARLEFEGSMYLTEDGKVGIPAWNIFQSGYSGAKSFKAGPRYLSGVTLLGADILPLQHDGPDTIPAMWNARCFDQRSVRVGTAKNAPRVTRTRPKFTNWSVDVSLLLDTSTINLADFKRAFEYAGLNACLGDYRPRFGRYEVTFK